jgi:hypothetical protein
VFQIPSSATLDLLGKTIRRRWKSGGFSIKASSGNKAAWGAPLLDCPTPHDAFTRV